MLHQRTPCLTGQQQRNLVAAPSPARRRCTLSAAPPSPCDAQSLVPVTVGVQLRGLRQHRAASSAALADTATTQTLAASPDAARTAPAVHIHPHVDVTQATFWDALTSIRKVLARSVFVAIDSEFTGLWAKDQYPRRLDAYQARYSKIKAAAEAFMPVQLGLCCFTRTAEGAWEAQTYNITIFPEPTAWNPYFSVTASTLEFLSNEGFDFSAWVRDGVRFMPLSARLHKAAELEFLTRKAQTGTEAAQADASSTSDADTDADTNTDTTPQSDTATEALTSTSTLGGSIIQAATSIGNGPMSPRSNSNTTNVRLSRDPETGELSLTDSTAWDAGLRALHWALFVASECGGAGYVGQRQWHKGLDPRLVSWPVLRRQVVEWLQSAAAAEQGQGSGGGGGGQPAVASVVMGNELSAQVLETLVTLELSSRPDLPSFTTSVTHTAAPGPQTTSSHTLSLPSPPSMSESQSDSTSASHHHEQAVARGDGWEVRVALKRVVPNQPAAVRGQGVQRRAIHQAAGPSVLLEAIQEYGVPVVLHNGVLDLALLLNHLRGGPLPTEWAQYKALVRRWFPGGVYDSKYLAALSPEQLSDGTPLENLKLQDLLSHVKPTVLPPTPHTAQQSDNIAYLDAVEQVFKSEACALSDTAEANASASNGEETSEQPGEGSAEPQTSSRYAHEAGFDALMAGLAFVALGQQGPGQHGSDQPAQDRGTDPLLGAVSPARNKIRGRMGVPYYHLGGVSDPVPDMPDVLVIAGLKPKTRWLEVSNRLKQLGVSQFRVIMHSTQPEVWAAPAPATHHTQPQTVQTTRRRRTQQFQAAAQQAAKAHQAPVAPAVHGDSCLVELMAPGASAAEVASRLRHSVRDWVVVTLAEWYSQR